jgi:enoyl-CoA hydratase/carnithine racemase
VLLETRDDIAIAWLNRPPANPLSPQAVRDLISVWEQVEGEARAFVIASSNIFTFSAGADIKEFTKMTPDAEGADLVESAHRFMRGMEASPTVTIAAVNSIAFGGGCELAMACDFRIAAESATFGQPEINLGIIPGAGGTQRWPRTAGKYAAMEAVLTGAPITAARAKELGIANKVVPAEMTIEVAKRIARQLAEKAPLALRMAKESVLNAFDSPLAEGLVAERKSFYFLFSTEDQKEGMRAFLEKRKAVFKGR